MRAPLPLIVLGGIVSIAVVASATITWQTTPSLITASATAPPVTFSEGSNADKERFMHSVTISENRTSFAASIHGKIGASTKVKDVVRLASNASAGVAVTLRGTQVSHPDVEAFEWRVKDGSDTRATLDMRSASPSATFAVATNTTYQLELTIRLAPGADGSPAMFHATQWLVVG